MGKAGIYAESLRSAYNDYRKQYEKTAERLHDIESDIEETRKNKDYTPKAKDSRLMLLRQKQVEQTRNLESIQNSAKQEFSRIRKDARSAFTQYRPNAESIDRDMLDLLDSGILSPSEIIEIINEKEYLQNNYTMSRMLGRKLEIMCESDKITSESERQQLLSVAYQLDSVSSPVEKMIDSFTVSAIAALRSDTLLADGVHESIMPDVFAELDAAAAAIDGE